jgi:hypothetical protein
MASIYSKDLEVYTAKKFRTSVSTANVYLAFGHPQQWINEENPPQANTSDASVYDAWKEMIGGKRITGNDIRHAIPRHNWSANTVYYAYDQLTDSLTLKNANTKPYVMTDDFHVFKCISNNKGAVSTTKPTSTNPTTTFQTADKYIWKYMYTLTSEEQLRFMTKDFIPVKTLVSSDNSLQWQVQEDAVPGAIHNILVTNPGSGYTSNSISVTIKGDGQYANAYAVRNVTTNQIDSFVVDNKGSGYTYANISIKATKANYATGNAIGRVIVSPPGGHGSDPVSELGGSYLMINVDLNGTEDEILTVANDYRQISIIENPYVYSTTKYISNLVFSQVTTISLSESSSTVQYSLDESVYQGKDIGNATFKGAVAAWDSTNNIIKLVKTEGTVTSDLLVGNTSTASRYVSAVRTPDLKPYSGHLLYKDNIPPISRAADQNENFKIILSF